MPEANFCQGCGQPFVASESASSSPSDRSSSTQSAAPRTCFRCSAPLADGASACEACGLDVEGLFGPSASQPDKAADLGELAFFKQPSAPDPQAGTLKTYAGWAAVVVLALVGSFAAYSWLEASNVINRLIGGNAEVFSAEVVKPQPTATQRPSRPTSAAAVAQPEVVSAGDLAATLSAPADGTRVKPAAVAPQPESSTAAAAPQTRSVDAFPTTTLEPRMEGAARATTQAYAPETAPLPVETAPSAPQAETAPAKPQKRVVVTQIEPNKNGDRPANELEAFFRRWKKSFRQGVEDRPCTQQERALNQCN